METNMKNFLLIVMLSLFSVHPYAASDDSLTFQIAPTQRTFNISLDANPTTGYLWNVTQYDKNIINKVTSVYVPSKTNLIGSGGDTTFVFSVNDGISLPQDTVVQFTYARPSDEAAGTIKTITVHLNAA